MLKAGTPTQRPDLREGQLVQLLLPPLHHRRPPILGLSSLPRGSQRSRRSMGPARHGLRPACRALPRVSAARFGLPVHRCWRFPQKGLCFFVLLHFMCFKFRVLLNNVSNQYPENVSHIFEIWEMGDYKFILFYFNFWRLYIWLSMNSIVIQTNGSAKNLHIIQANQQ